jgi:hypothetical protein
VAAGHRNVGIRQHDLDSSYPSRLHFQRPTGQAPGIMAVGRPAWRWRINFARVQREAFRDSMDRNCSRRYRLEQRSKVGLKSSPPALRPFTTFGNSRTFWHLGGVTRTVVIYNLRAAVIHPDWCDPALNPRSPIGVCPNNRPQKTVSACNRVSYGFLAQNT